MIEFKITYTHNGVKKTIVGITNSLMNSTVCKEAHPENQLTEVEVYKNRQKPDDRWNIGPSYIHELYFDNQGATLYFRILTNAEGKIKRRDFIGMTVMEDADYGIPEMVNVEYKVETKYIEDEEL